MYAVIESGGKQYRVELGSEIEVDRMDAEPGKTIDLERVLLVVDGDSPAIGTPTVDGAVVRADVVRQDRGDKIVVFKYKPKARTRVKKGHRRDLTVLRIADIAFGGRSAAEDAKAAQKVVDRERKKHEQEAAAQAKRDQELAARLAEAQAAAEAEAEAKAPASKSRKRRSPAAPAAVDAVAGDTADEPAEGAAPSSETPAEQPEPLDPPEPTAQDPTKTKDE
ncbi:hypothetical protein BH18CHL1_BH18CHL1_07830 [soil metagenome]